MLTVKVISQIAISGPRPMSTQGLFPVFPQEIIIEFVKNLIGSDHITWNERNSLLSCCLTSRAFSAAARRHIWSTVSLSSYKAGSPDQNISKQLSIHEFSQDIQRLKELLGSPTSDLSQLMHSLIISLDPTHYLVKELEELLTIIASRASNLKQLCLERTPWDTIPPGTSQSFIKVVRLPCLSTIDLSLMANVPEDIVKNSTALRSLYLSTVEFAKPDSHSVLPLNEFLHHKAEYGFADCDRSVTGTNILHIESITMRLLSSDAPKFGRLVGTISHSLTSLDLYVRYRSILFRN